MFTGIIQAMGNISEFNDSKPKTITINTDERTITIVSPTGYIYAQ